MNPVEIEELVSKLAKETFDPKQFPFKFLTAFGNKKTTIKRLLSGTSNKSTVGGVLQANNIHIKVSNIGEVQQSLKDLKDDPATKRFKAKFIVATDGVNFEAEQLSDGELIACKFSEFHNHFGFFLPLAGIYTLKDIKECSFDIKATGRLNKLYIQLIKDNPSMGLEENKEIMNHFMARLIFCFFSEDTDIFGQNTSFTETVEKFSARDSSDTHKIISSIFKVMNIPINLRDNNNIPVWAKKFPYVNGGLFAGEQIVPFFSKIAKSYLINIGNLDWTKINPDIFGSMIQAVADDEERGTLGMHYTSASNILKVLNPLFLDKLKEKLNDAGNNSRKLLNLLNRISKIRVFDPACGSGNFLVIAYKELRAIEAEINKKIGNFGCKSIIPLTNFRGIEVRSFSAEIARLALIISEYQCNVIYVGQKEAFLEFLPLEKNSWITCGNALEIDWLKVLPSTDRKIDNLINNLDNESNYQFVHKDGETYICGNPPYLGSSLQSEKQKNELKNIFSEKTNKWKILDYVSAWFFKAAEYCQITNSQAAFVSTNSICQGQHVPVLWPIIFNTGNVINFSFTAFKWSNLASNNATVTVVIISISRYFKSPKKIFSINSKGDIEFKLVKNINAYLVAGEDLFVMPRPKPSKELSNMEYGSKPADGGHLILSYEEKKDLLKENGANEFILPFVGGSDFIKGNLRFCLWITKNNLSKAKLIKGISKRIDKVRSFRVKSKKVATYEASNRPYSFSEIRYGSSLEKTPPIIVPIHTGENRDYLPIGYLPLGTVVSNASFAIYDAPLWTLAIITSKIHLVWISTVCGKLGTSFRYSNTLGWNTFPLPELTDKNKKDLTSSAEDILIARETHFPKSIVDLYDCEQMPENLKNAHQKNDEILERIFIGRCFRNDSERIEKLFDLYCKKAKKN